MLQNIQAIPVNSSDKIRSIVWCVADKRDVYLTFKALNTTRSGILSIDEFYNIYEYVGLSWKVSVVQGFVIKMTCLRLIECAYSVFLTPEHFLISGDIVASCTRGNGWNL